MTRLIAAEFFKLRKRMMTWVLAILLVGLIVLMYSILWSISGRVEQFGDRGQFDASDLRRALYLQSSVPFSLQIVSLFGTILAIVLAAGAVGSEYSWGTMRLIATASSGRLRLIAAKLIVVCALIVAGALLAIAVGLAYSSIITLWYGGADFDFVTRAFLRDQLAAFGRTLFIMMPYVALAFAAAVVGRSTLVGVGAGIGFAFIEPFVGGLMRLADEPWRSIPNFLLNANTQIIALQNRVPEVARIGPNEQDVTRREGNTPEEAALVLLCWIVVFIAVAFWTYRRRDITA